ncbi:hypothetical protein [Bacillus mobilis]|uniref:hypothetical protein n=3 Tax=Bacillus mobilis TaxID=2026190 RepID=UPI0021CD74F4|nr:hypothetical protein [Bacillus mobilis]MCU5594428.1 hypothetical protein [Bacillus mobilis]MCU9558185.1 hypothetical protein [Bacillus mobilis]HDR7514040.1 hypothetical protein [Bacillus mobilis]HDR7546494.1 hypothetical protein [Bacillus mobilis]HDR7553127.1 hypothetical protein [Bacillus mobilis]
MDRIALISYYFLDTDGVGSARARYIDKILKTRGNDISYFTRTQWGKYAYKRKLIWILFCIYHLVNQKNIKTVYITCGPFWHLFIISLVCKIFNKRLIVDFRDPWSLNIKNGYGSTNYKFKAIKLHVAEFIEKFTYKNCCYFWVCTSGMEKGYGRLFGDSEKILFIPNGFDINAEAFTNIINKRDSNKNNVNIVCLGKFAEYGYEEARKKLIYLKESFSKEKIKITFIGSDLILHQKLICEVGLNNQVEFIEKRPYFEALEIAASHDIGICLVRNEEIEFGTKMYDYIALEIPVYDWFEDNKEFKIYFRSFLTKSAGEKVDFSKKNLYSRERIFLSYISLIDNK